MKRAFIFTPVCLLLAVFTYASVTEQGISSGFWKAEVVVLLLLFIAYAVGVVVRAVWVVSIRNAAQRNYGKELRIKNLLYALIAPLPKYAHLQDCAGEFSTIVVFVRRKYAKYHFDTPRILEIYVGNRETYRTGKLQYSIGKSVTWKLANRITIPASVSKRCDFVFSRVPMDVTSSDVGANAFLCNGDAFFSGYHIYTKKSFLTLPSKFTE